MKFFSNTFVATLLTLALVAHALPQADPTPSDPNAPADPTPSDPSDPSDPTDPSLSIDPLPGSTSDSVALPTSTDISSSSSVPVTTSTTLTSSAPTTTPTRSSLTTPVDTPKTTVSVSSKPNGAMQTSAPGVVAAVIAGAMAVIAL